ncbi:interleukin-10 receptor subunit alpha [Liasis olivaceus]
MLVPALLLLPLLLPRCLRGHGGERIPAPPVDVHFQAHIFHHLLLWEPGAHGSPVGGILYEVQYRRVGNDSWRAAANCTRIALRSCDLTYETRQPAAHYLARVRAVAGNRTSAWRLTRRFAPKEATLWLSKVTLSRSGNQLHVSLQLPTSRWANLTYEDSYQVWGEYHARVRRVSNNAQFVHVHSSLEFDLPPLLWGEQYCISVKPRVASRPNPADWTEEQCVSIPPLEGHTEAPVLTPSLVLLSLLSLGMLGAGLGLASAYKKKPMNMPSVLKFPIQHSFCRGLTEESKGRVLHMETESIQQLFSLGPQEHVHFERRRNHHTGAELPENSCQLEDGMGLQEGSGCSADSGICLQEPSGSLSNLHFSGTGSSLDICQKKGIQEDVGSFWMEQRPLLSERSPSKDLTQNHFSGYKKQSGAPLDGETLPQPSLTTGYLKQTFLGAPSGLKVIALTKNFLHRMDQEKEQFPNSMSLGVLGPWELPCKSPQTLLSLGFSEQEPVTPPLQLSVQR